MNSMLNTASCVDGLYLQLQGSFAPPRTPNQGLYPCTLVGLSSQTPVTGSRCVFATTPCFLYMVSDK